MKQPILVTYRSVTGFTQQYAQWIAEALGGACRPLADLSKDDMAAYGTVIFGGRFHAGSVDGLKQAKALAAACQVPRFLVFATGATPAAAQDQIAAAWAANLTPEEAARIPHFYFPGGLRYEAPGGQADDESLFRHAPAQEEQNPGRAGHGRGHHSLLRPVRPGAHHPPGGLRHRDGIAQ